MTVRPWITDDEWQRAATAQAIAAARRVVGQEGVNPRAMISSLSDTEWGWIVCAVIFGWVAERAKQAVHEGLFSTEQAITTLTYRQPQPWESGAVETILPGLSNTEGIDWSKPVGEWAKDQVVAFAWQAHRLIDGALAARDEGVSSLHIGRGVEEHERVSRAASGGPLMTQDEMDEPIPF